MYTPDQPTTSHEGEAIQGYPEFRPGDLIHGDNTSVWTYIDEGISSARSRSVKGRQFGDRMISFAMLGNDTTPADRSNNSMHSGPAYSGEKLSFMGVGTTAIIIDREKLLARFPHNVSATGSAFKGLPGLERKYDRYKEGYDNPDNATTVYGIPIDYYNIEIDFYIANGGAWDDDVIVYSYDKAQDPILTPDLWSGYVIDGSEKSLSRLQRDLAIGIQERLKMGMTPDQITALIPNVPIINAKTGVWIGKTLRELALMRS